jgi:peroxiredoxin
MSQGYELWDEERGISKRAVVIIDEDGVIAFRKVYERPDLPEAQDILAEVDKIR